MSDLTSGHQKLQKPIATIELSTFDLCRIQCSIKIEAFAVLRPNLWPKTQKVPILTEVKIEKHQESQKNIVAIEFVTLNLFRVQNVIKIEALSFLVYNFGLKTDRCQH